MGCTHSASSPVIAIGSPSSSSSSSSLPSTPYVAARRAIENGNLGKLRKILNRPELLTSATPLTAEDLETLCTVAARTDRIQCLMLLADYADRANIHLTFVAAYLAANIHDQRVCFDFIVDRMPEDHRPTIVVYPAPFYL